MSQSQIKKYRRTIKKKRVELIIEFIEAIKLYPLRLRTKFALQIIFATKPKRRSKE